MPRRAASRGSCRLAWGALGIGLVSMAVGDLIYSLAPDLGNVPVPSASDPFWLALYPCEYVALVALTRRRVGRTLWATRLDGLVGGLAIASVLACWTVSAAVQGSAGAPFWETATNLAYPVGDLILLAAIVSAVGLGGWRIDRLWATLGAAIIALVAADVLYISGALENGADAIMATGVVAMAWAATLAPGLGGASRPVRAARGLFVPVGFSAVALGVLALGVSLHFNGVALSLAVVALGLGLARMALALRENGALLIASHAEATTDALTGLGNRRKLQLDLPGALEGGGAHALVLLDLNGFKAYNDNYGHGVGDMLLGQLGVSLAEAVDGLGEAYRMGGDEFCVLAPHDGDPAAFSAYSGALATRGDGFEITAAHGAVLLPDEGREASTILALADARMYQHKNAGRPPAAHQSVDVLLAVMSERAPGLVAHVHAVCELACALAEELGVTGAELDTPALHRSARLVRNSHERIDGSGYPDGLAGVAIPLGSRIILVADAFDAMVSERPYGIRRSVAEAVAELRRCAGTQFDAAVVAAFERVIERRPQLAPAI